MLALLFSSNYPGPHAPFWQYFGAALDYLVLALCFAAFGVGKPTDLSIRSYLSDRKRRMKTAAALLPVAQIGEFGGHLRAACGISPGFLSNSRTSFWRPRVAEAKPPSPGTPGRLVTLAVLTSS
jgi:hypothetical protein